MLLVITIVLLSAIVIMLEILLVCICKQSLSCVKTLWTALFRARLADPPKGERKKEMVFFFPLLWWIWLLEFLALTQRALRGQQRDHIKPSHTFLYVRSGNGNWNFPRGVFWMCYFGSFSLLDSNEVRSKFELGFYDKFLFPPSLPLLVQLSDV